MNKPNPVSYTIKRIGANATEDIQADSILKIGDPPSFHFSTNGNDVFEIYVHALEREPIPNYPRTAEEKEAWRKLVAESKVVPRGLR